MKDFLRKLKLVKDISIELNIQKNDFVSNFKRNVDEGSTGFMSDAFDIFSSSKNEYKGYVRFDHFKIKRRRRFLDMNLNLAVAKGTYVQRGDLLIVETEINGFNGAMMPFYIILPIFYSIFIVVLIFNENVGGKEVGFAIPFLIIHAAFLLGIPYLMMRKSINRMAHELEREFFYLTKAISRSE
ncbi:hypothetical protein [Echinicola sp. 20G]|uniref:hypothetical protein n=1 Tax=Echinicola sp. 20G TaxID=2781961 RepID=UPI0019104CAF|nr:hypothetical protein [Echinicola sp. 20G]